MNLSNSRRNLANGNFYELDKECLNMRSSRAQSSTWTKCKFRKTSFDASDFSGARFVDCMFVECSFQNSVFIGSDIQGGLFNGCDMVSSNFSTCRVRDTSFFSCKMEYSSFLDCNIFHIDFRGCDMSGSYLLYMYAKDVDYSGSNLHNVSIKLGCPFFRDSKFDARQWSYMQALISQVEGVKDLQEKVIPHIDPTVLAAARRMMSDEHEEEF